MAGRWLGRRWRWIAGFGGAVLVVMTILMYRELGRKPSHRKLVWTVPR